MFIPESRVGFLTAILHRGLRNDFFFSLIYFFQFLFGLLFPFFLRTFIFPFLFGLLFPFFLGTFIFSLDFYFLFGLLFSLFSLDFYFPFIFGLLFSLWTFIQSRSHFGFLPNFFSYKVRYSIFRNFHLHWKEAEYASKESNLIIFSFSFGQLGRKPVWWKFFTDSAHTHFVLRTNFVSSFPCHSVLCNVYPVCSFGQN